MSAQHGEKPDSNLQDPQRLEYGRPDDHNTSNFKPEQQVQRPGTVSVP